MLIAAGIRAGVKGYKAHEAKKEKERKEEEERLKSKKHPNAPPSYTTHPSNEPHSNTAYKGGFGTSHSPASTPDLKPFEGRRSIGSDSDSDSSVSSVNDDDRARFPSLSSDELKELKKQEKLARKEFKRANEAQAHGQGKSQGNGQAHDYGHSQGNHTGASGRGRGGGRGGRGGRGGGGDGAKVWGKVLKGVMLG
ncbi:hypothetical protein I302_109124 [Kwoniella bestiolae CBS 10118]|uniref:DUF3824 domain-containing protein n=1 Tax=Kwoniella bestiolae CBS 10118 TaxID=1296100 RepID=A0A1B9FV19_9TREE|nr:hypothetical protein I302_08270 [Kwoniella bestiolae CBS 10118]OCF22619.1 hypothetical protein I302_08270 [Kwoniella bestiolae CBS 10118]